MIINVAYVVVGILTFIGLMIVLMEEYDDTDDMIGKGTMSIIGAIAWPLVLILGSFALIFLGVGRLLKKLNVMRVKKNFQKKMSVCELGKHDPRRRSRAAKTVVAGGDH